MSFILYYVVFSVQFSRCSCIFYQCLITVLSSRSVNMANTDFRKDVTMPVRPRSVYTAHSYNQVYFENIIEIESMYKFGVHPYIKFL